MSLIRSQRQCEGHPRLASIPGPVIQLRLGLALPQEPAGLQVNEHFLATARGIGKLPLIAAVRPPRHLTAARAGRLARTGPGHHLQRPARRYDTIDGQASQVRDQDGQNLKIARPA